jgi:hypothetical protein
MIAKPYMDLFLRMFILLLVFSLISACDKEERDKRATIITINSTGYTIDTLCIQFSFGQIDKLVYYNIGDSDTTSKESVINTSAEIYFQISSGSNQYSEMVYCGCGAPPTSYEYLGGCYTMYILEFDSINNYFPIAYIREDACIIQ